MSEDESSSEVVCLACKRCFLKEVMWLSKNCCAKYYDECLHWLQYLLPLPQMCGYSYYICIQVIVTQGRHHFIVLLSCISPSQYVICTRCFHKIKHGTILYGCFKWSEGIVPVPLSMQMAVTNVVPRCSIEWTPHQEAKTIFVHIIFLLTFYLMDLYDHYIWMLLLCVRFYNLYI